VSSHTFRVTVRGMFDGLTDAQRGELLAGAAEHDVLRAEFTALGNLTYDLAARPFFTFRYLDAGPDDAGADAGAALAAATGRAEAAARSWLDGHGYGYKNLRASAEDLSQVPLGSRARREARRSG
jgi:hypothetical protein